jgi:hypothetical protein
MQFYNTEIIVTHILLNTVDREHVNHYSLSPSLGLLSCCYVVLQRETVDRPSRLFGEQLIHKAAKLTERKTDQWECLFVRPP